MTTVIYCAKRFSFREAIIKKKCVKKEIVLIYLDPLPPPPKKEIKNKEIFVPFLTSSLLPKIRKSDIFLGVFKKPNFAFLNHNQSVYIRSLVFTIENPRKFQK